MKNRAQICKPGGFSLGQVHEWVGAFGRAGGNPNLLQETIENQKLMEQVVNYWQSISEPWASQKCARETMGANFFRIADDWLAFYGVALNGVILSQKQLQKIVEFPWGRGILNSTCPLCGKIVRDCHFAFVGFDCINGKPLTILRLQELYPATGQPKFYSYAPSAWYSEQKFAKETTMDFRWYLLHQNIVPKSEDKTFDEQKTMLTADYEVPSAITEVVKDLLIFRKTGNFANQSRYARCECVTSDGGRVDVGMFSEEGLYIDGCWGVASYGDVGIAASRKL